MAEKKGDFTEILLRQRIISPEQLAEAKRIAKDTNKKVAEELIRLGYASGEEVIRAMAREHGLEYVNLSEVVIPPSVVELVPESVARENAVLPLAEEGASLKVIISDPLDYDTQEKLRFILNRNIEIALRPARKHPGGDQPPLRAGRRRVGRLDAPGVHRYGHRLHRDDRRSRPAKKKWSTKPVRRSCGSCI